MHHLTESLVNFSTIHFIVIIRLSHKLIPFLGINHKDKCIILTTNRMWQSRINLEYILIFALQWQLTLMEGLKVHLCHIMLWDFKQRYNAMEMFRKKKCRVYSPGVSKYEIGLQNLILDKHNWKMSTNQSTHQTL